MDRFLTDVFVVSPLPCLSYLSISHFVELKNHLNIFNISLHKQECLRSEKYLFKKNRYPTVTIKTNAVLTVQGEKACRNSWLILHTTVNSSFTSCKSCREWGMYWTAERSQLSISFAQWHPIKWFPKLMFVSFSCYIPSEMAQWALCMISRVSHHLLTFRDEGGKQDQHSADRKENIYLANDRECNKSWSKGSILWQTMCCAKSFIALDRLAILCSIQKVSQISAEHKNNAKPRHRAFIYSLETFHSFWSHVFLYACVCMCVCIEKHIIGELQNKICVFVLPWFSLQNELVSY